MQISNLNLFKSNNHPNNYNNKIFHLKLKAPINYDTVSFSAAKKDLEYYLNHFEEEEMPKRVYKEAKIITETLPRNEWPTIVELHDRIYAPLKEAETLEEAKEMFYPDFENVLPLSEVDCKGLLSYMKKGEVPQPENDVALYMLKCTYKQIDNTELPESFINHNISKFNIKPLSRKYATTVVGSKKSLERWQDEEYKLNRSNETKKLWENDEYRKKQEEIHQNPEYRKIQSELTKELWQDDEYYKAHSEAIKKLWENDEYREAIKQTRCQEEFKQHLSEALKKSWQDPERKEAMSQFMEELWQDDEYRKKQEEASKRPEVIKARSENLKKLWQDPEFRDMVIELGVLSWQNSEAVIEVMRELSPEFLESMGAYAKRKKGGQLTNAETVLSKTFYKNVYQTEGMKQARIEAYRKAKEEYAQQHNVTFPIKSKKDNND